MDDEHMAVSMRTPQLDRRAFLGWASRRGALLGLAGASLPAVVAACGSDVQPAAQRRPASRKKPDVEGEAIVGDVLDFALASGEWQGDFGFVEFRLHEAVLDGEEALYIRTDASDEGFAKREGLVFAPKLKRLARSGLSGTAYMFEDGPAGQPTLLSSAPFQAAYTPAWNVQRVGWKAAPRKLLSTADVLAASRKGDVSIEKTGIVFNGALVKWPGGEMPQDTELTAYIGPGQLIEPPDVKNMTVTFKLHECFPGVRYIVCDTSMEPMAVGMQVAHSPLLAKSTEARATGRTNVFMNGIKGPGPMGFQPSVFDSAAGSPEWSPYWDHMTYAWRKGIEPRVLRTENQIHAARDEGDLEEFVGTPDTKGAIFTVNCPVPVMAPNTFTA